MSEHSIKALLRAKVAAMCDIEKEAFVELMYTTGTPTPEMLDEFTLIMLGETGPADTPEK
jgi:hypothetical protein